MHLGKREEALQTLEKGYQRHDPYPYFLAPLFTKSSTRYAPTRVFRRCSTVWVFRDSPAHMSGRPICRSPALFLLVFFFLSLSAFAQIQMDKSWA